MTCSRCRDLSGSRVARLAVWFCALLCLTGYGISGTLHAADGARKTTALAFAPADAAFFSSSMRMKETWSAMFRSRAAGKLVSLPTVQMLRDLTKAAFEDAGDEHGVQQYYAIAEAAVSTWYADEMNQNLVSMVGEMFSDEVFVLGSSELNETLADLQAMSRELSAIQRKAIEKGGEEPADQKALMKIVLAKLRVPAVMMGFRVRNVEQAQDQLNRAQESIESILDGFDEDETVKAIRQRMKSKTIGKDKFHVLELDSGLIDWDSLEGQSDAETLALVREALIGKTLTLAWGMRGEYLIMYFGGSLKTLEMLGQGPLLYDTAHFARLRQHADEPITDLAYVSEPMVRAAGDSSQTINSYLETLRSMLASELGGELSEDLKTRLNNDITEIGKFAQAHQPTFGAMVDFRFMTAKGHTRFTQSWSRDPLLDGTQPLSVLEHVGGKPLILAASRQQTHPEDYEALVKALVKIDGYVTELYIPTLDEDEKIIYDEARKELLPLIQKLHEAVGKLLIPALRDGQTAIVADAALESAQWHNGFQTQQPLPLVEWGIVLGVSDAEKFRSGAAELIAVINQSIGLLHKYLPEIVDDGTIPEPEREDTAVGTFYSYPLSKSLGLDPRLAPQLGLSRQTAAFAFSREHAERMLAPTALTVEGPAGKTDRPLAAVCYLDFAGLMDVADTWVAHAQKFPDDFAPLRKVVDELMEDEDDDDEDAKDEEKSDDAKDTKEKDDEEDADKDDDEKAEKDNEKSRVNKVLENYKPSLQELRDLITILKCFRGYSSATFVEDKSTVTHMETYFQDLPE